MKFKQFLISEGRSKQIPNYAASKLLEKNCQVAMDSWQYAPIYRGIGSGFSYLYIDPKQGTRRSANTKNYYTLINDNSKAWSKYPKRSQSLICTTDVNYTSSYGKSYTVFPYDGAKIGVCPKDDYWKSFDEGLENGNASALHEFNYDLNDIFKKHMNIQINDKTFKSITDAFKNFDLIVKDRQIVTFEIKYSWFNGYNGNLLELVNSILHPMNNSFELKKIGDDLTRGEEREVWTDSKCILIEWMYNNDPSEKMVNELIK